MNSGPPCPNLLLSIEHSGNFLVRDTEEKETEECKNKRRNKESVTAETGGKDTKYMCDSLCRSPKPNTINIH